MEVKYLGEHCIIVANQDEVNQIIKWSLKEGLGKPIACRIYTKLAGPISIDKVQGYFKHGWFWGKEDGS